MTAIEQQLSNTVQEVLDGNFSALEAFATMKHLADHLALCMETIKPTAIEEAKKYEKGSSYHGYKLSVNPNAGARWDYSHIGEWKAAKEKLSEIEERAKIAYQQSQKGVMSVANDGEVIEMARYKGGKETIVLEGNKPAWNLEGDTTTK